MYQPRLHRGPGASAACGKSLPLSPPPGSYTAAQSVSLTDSTPAALIYYTTNNTTPTIASALYSAGTPLQISSTTTVQAIAVASGYSTSAVSSGTRVPSVRKEPHRSGLGEGVNLSAVDNVVGIANTGSPVPSGGFDSEGYAYAATLLGGSLSWAGSTFTLGAAGSVDAVSSTTIALPAGNDATQ